MTPEQKRILGRGLRGTAIFGTGGAMVGGRKGALLGGLIGGALGAGKELIKSNKEKRESIKEKLKRYDKGYDKMKNNLETKLREKTQDIKYLGPTVGGALDLNKRFDESFPITGKIIDLGIINPMIPIPGGTIVGMGGKALGGGVLKIKDKYTKVAASFSDTRNMLNWAKNNNYSILRNPKDVVNKITANNTQLNGVTSKNSKSLINYIKKQGPHYEKSNKIIYIPKQKDFDYKSLNMPVTDVLGHELGHAKDMGFGLSGWLKRKTYGVAGALSQIPAERRANTQALNNFISPSGKESFIKTITEGAGFKSYTDSAVNQLTGRSYKDTKGLKYQNWVQRRTDAISGRFKNFLTNPFKTEKK